MVVAASQEAGLAGSGTAISVVIPCWNAERWIARAIGSLRDQNCSGLEIIVVDDGSTDGSPAAVAAFGDAVKRISGPNRGASAARNIGLRAAASPLVMFLDADDYLDPGSLGRWAADFDDDCDLLIGPFAYEFGDVRRHAPHLPRSAQPIDVLHAWLKGRFTPPCAILWRRAFLVEIGGWTEPSLPRNQDGELVMRAILMGARTRISETGLGIYVQHDGPDRISRRSGAAVIASELEVFSRLWRLAQERGFTFLRPCFAKAFYGIANYAYSEGADGVGAAALRGARRLGYRGHDGTLAHRIGASLLGLRMKSKLAGLSRSVRRSLSSQRA